MPRTCCCCFTITTGVTLIGMFTGFDIVVALFSLTLNFNWLVLILRGLALPLFIIGCCRRKSLAFRRVFAILFGLLCALEIVGRIGIMYYIYSHTTKIDEACDEAQAQQMAEIEAHEQTTGATVDEAYYLTDA